MLNSITNNRILTMNTVRLALNVNSIAQEVNKNDFEREKIRDESDRLMLLITVLEMCYVKV